jgi:phytoene dehydrogenase-like protein
VNITDQTTYDVLIIGGGHNGLTTACYLAKAGLEVAVLEAADQIGGMTASGTPISTAPQHVVNYCAADLLFWLSSPVDRELELDRFGLKKIVVDPSYVYLHPDGASIAVWKDPRRTADEIRRFSRADADAYLEYARFLDALFDIVFPYMLTNPQRPDLRTIVSMARGTFKHRRLLRRFGYFLLASGEETIDQRFEHPVTRSLLYCLGAGANPINQHGTSLTHLFLAFLHRSGTARPVGGMQAIPNALANRFTALGGTISTGSEVAEIVVTGGRAAGVRLTDGRTFTARRAVVCTPDPRTTLAKLLPAGTLSGELDVKVRHIPANSSGAGAMKADLALSGRLTLERHQRWRGDDVDLRVPAVLVGTSDQIRRGWSRAAAGIVPDADDVALWPVLLNGADPSQAPDGQDSLYLFATNMPLHPEGGWNQWRDKAANTIVERAGQFYDGIAELEIGRWVETPELAAERNRVTNGAAMHVDHLLFSQGPLRPAMGLAGTSLPVKGLVLGGAGTHPGGGVSGIPGRRAAVNVLASQRGGLAT